MPEKILFMGSLYPKEQKQEILRKSKSTMETAMDELQWNLISGLEHHLHSSMDIITMLPVYSFPKHYRDWYVRGFSFEHAEGARDVSVGFLNIMWIKQFFLNAGLWPQVSKWLHSNPNDNKIILLYSLKRGELKSIYRAKKAAPAVRAYAVVADLPQYLDLSENTNLIKTLFSQWSQKQIRRYMKSIDGFVLLTEQMKDALELGSDVPHCVVEGIAKESSPLPARSQDGQKRIVYTGTLHKQFGIAILLEAFEQIQDDSYRLILCGRGDYEDKIRELSQVDNRIEFLGIVPHEEVLKIQQNATVLVNPRQNNEEFTKYSFPSKTMEYLSSGRPVVAYLLDGMPREYEEYLVCPKNDSAACLAHTLTSVCEMPEQDREALGTKGRNYVLEEKNAIRQTEKIVDLIFQKSH